MKHTRTALVLLLLPLAALVTFGGSRQPAVHSTRPIDLSRSPELTVEVTSVSGPYQIGLTASVRFRNHTGHPLKILKPVDGSEWRMVYPHYYSTVTGPNGSPLDFHGRCGNTGVWYWQTKPEDYVVSIPPNGSVTQGTVIPVQAAQSGRHTLQFRYVFKPEGYDEPKKTVYPPGLWVGSTNTTVYPFDLDLTKAR